ncbi:MAG TPA: TetR/AcrR family transcriptional regulator [Clostridiales bacterium]|nr:TetR/AcrR family transcriptional regulator [Clostridiales bacterium]
MTHFTREAIMEKFVEMLKTTPLDNITVSDIIEVCGISRSTFDYHFHDLYDLLWAWIEQESANYIDPSTDLDSWQDVFKRTLQGVENNKEAIGHIFPSAYEERLSWDFFALLAQRIYEIVCWQGRDLNMSDKLTREVAAFYRDMAFGFLLRYIQNRMNFDAKKYIDNMSVLFEDNIWCALKKYAVAAGEETEGNVTEKASHI